MYTIDDERNDIYDDEYDEDVRWNNRKSLIFKIVIIILCIIVLIWLIKALRNNSNLADNGEVHTANVEKVRLAAEDYYFLKNNKKDTISVNLSTLQSNGLVGEIVDANNKVCSNSGTKVYLQEDVGTYKMTVKLDCSTKDKDEIFYYNYNTLACLNCSSKTNMTGQEVIAKADEENGVEENVNNDIRYDDEEYNYYSCIDWSDWSKDRVYDSSLTERSKTLVSGVKYGTKTTYSDWSAYTTTPIETTEDMEVETKVVTDKVWSEQKTDSNIDITNPNIKILSQETVNETSNKCSGYVENGVCYSNKTVVHNITFNDFNNGNYNIKKDSCEGLKTLLNDEGLYVLTYVNCKYNEVIPETSVVTNSYTVYTYQELEPKDVTYYRYRTLIKTEEPVEYTTVKYEEKDLPKGFVKVPGSEETYYSYKLTECVK